MDIFINNGANINVYLWQVKSHHGLYIPATIYIMGLTYILYIKVVYKETNKIEAELKNKNIIK